jgi:hypothetical protein
MFFSCQKKIKNKILRAQLNGELVGLLDSLDPLCSTS